MIVSFNGLFILAERVEQGSRNEDLEDGGCENGKTPKAKADHVLVKVERHCAQGLSTVLNAGELDDDGHDEDDEEKRVVEEVGKYVDLR